ncbi:hypothetical protein ETU10_10425 [Apibacter muscae]|uniref:hypothetical protein n=1 Tax=Apibacter muscae TaxID=2509004 RepID=UPI0011AD43DC|nr:hypothetical protein [Apibacter muscae]TWP22995.1 hypothetical protein ETU10_10425 [Apibacter muscae]
MSILKFKYSCLAFVTITFLVACNNTNENLEKNSNTNVITHNQHTSELKENVLKKGDHVPSNKVCMVNDEYMGKEQLEVPLDGKMYYGCCEMCKNRIPQDEKVRYSIDPLTHKKVDKALAYIVLASDDGQVYYFENESNFLKFNNKN